MTARVALCRFLLEGRVLSIANCFKEIGLSNPARELPRMVETPFEVEISRTPRTGTNRYGSPVSFTEYRLNITEYNKNGVEKMEKFVKDNGGTVIKKRPVGRPKTNNLPAKQEAILTPKKQQTLF